MKKSIRSHDKFYLNENFKEKPKESFKFILNKLKGSLNNKKIIDIGCSNGDFLYHISKKFPKSKTYGIDVDNNLINKTKKEVPNIIKVYKQDISKKLRINEKFDYIFMSGVHSIFDDCDKWFSNIVKMRHNNKSRIYIFGIWNDDDVDVIIRMKKSSNKIVWEKGWNIFSKKTIVKIIKSYSLNHKFYKFNLKIEIKKNKGDPFRSWTVKLKNNKNLILNGGCIAHKFYLLEVFK